MNDLYFLSVNINGVYDKLENLECIEFLALFDIVFVFELKCTNPVNVPGFKAIRSSFIKGEDLRGGTAVLVKHELWLSVCRVKRYKDQVWFTLSVAPYVRFGAVYIPPSDSPYFDPVSFAHIRSECLAHPRSIFSGDINARIPELSEFQNEEYCAEYETNVDRGSNSNGTEFSAVWKECHLLPINHLKLNGKSFAGDLTFRKSRNWISQLDWLVCDVNSLSCINSLSIMQNTLRSARNRHVCASTR